MFGLSDGLVSNTALVLGVAAGSDSAAVMLAGVAGLLAGAASMAAGEWISMTAQREALEQELAMEQDHLNRYPADERAHMIDILMEAGLSKKTADQVAVELEEKPGANLEFHARVELGIDPGELGSPARAAAASFGAFAFGAAVPMVPWVFSMPVPVLLTAILSGIALFGAGAGLSRYTPRGAVFSGTRQLLVGVVAAVMTMSIGALIGVAV